MNQHADGYPVLPMLSLVGWFERQVEHTPDQIAVCYGSDRLTYRELNARANQWAHCLRQQGVGPDVLVGLFFERSLNMVVALLGILKAGGAYVPMDPRYPKERLEFMMNDARIAVLTTERSLLANLPDHSVKTICSGEPDLLAQPGTNPSAGAEPDHLAYVIYTSGSTGKPKGVLVTHRNVVRLFWATEAWYQFNGQDVWTLFHSISFDFSVWELWGALLYGGRLVVVPYLTSRSPEEFYALLEREQVTVLNQTPSAFRQLSHVEETAPEVRTLALRYVIFGGEALDLRSLKPWFERHGDRRPQLVNMYGITETTVHVTYRPLAKADLDSGSVIGGPIPDLEVYILDPQGHLVPVGVPGELYVAGAGVARGYLRRPELTAARFLPNPFKPGSTCYRTGDRARFLPNRDIEYLGRIDDQVKIRGFRIEPGEIENALCAHPGVREAAVVARDDAGEEKRLVAYVVPRGVAPAVQELRQHLLAQLAEYMVPSAFVMLEKLPLTHNGKVDRKALPAPTAQRPQLSTSYVTPRTPTEQTLAAGWRAVLGIEQVGINDNFFELGGSSLLLVKLLGRLRETPGCQVEITHLFQYPTIRALGAFLDRRRKPEVTRSARRISTPAPAAASAQPVTLENAVT